MDFRTTINVKSTAKLRQTSIRTVVLIPAKRINQTKWEYVSYDHSRFIVYSYEILVSSILVYVHKIDRNTLHGILLIFMDLKNNHKPLIPVDVWLSKTCEGNEWMFLLYTRYFNSEINHFCLLSKKIKTNREFFTYTLKIFNVMMIIRELVNVKKIINT